jgi:hypothetical protein
LTGFPINKTVPSPPSHCLGSSLSKWSFFWICLCHWLPIWEIWKLTSNGLAWQWGHILLGVLYQDRIINPFSILTIYVQSYELGATWFHGLVFWCWGATPSKCKGRMTHSCQLLLESSGHCSHNKWDNNEFCQCL